MSIILPNLKHLFICPVPVPDFLVFHTPFSCNRCVRFSFDIKGSLGCWRALTLSCAPNNILFSEWHKTSVRRTYIDLSIRKKRLVLTVLLLGGSSVHQNTHTEV